MSATLWHCPLPRLTIVAVDVIPPPPIPDPATPSTGVGVAVAFEHHRLALILVKEDFVLELERAGVPGPHASRQRAEPDAGASLCARRVTVGVLACVTEA